MTSIGSFAKQIPLNNGYFRPLPELAQGLSTIGQTGGGPIATAALPTNFMYTLVGTTMSSFIANNTANTATLTSLNAGASLLKDMGTNFLSSQANGTSSPIVFRRVQIVDTQLAMATDGVSGGLAAAGSDGSYNTAYILMGFNGATPAGPFVRTG